MKKVYLFIFVFLLIGIEAVYATNYYVSPTGNNAHNGSIISPWQTINKVNSEMPNFNPGDSILFERNGVFTGSLVIGVSGASGSPVVFSAYGTGNNPVITSDTTISNWIADGPNKWISPYNKRPEALYIGNTPQQIARYPNRYGTPNGGYLTYSNYSGDTEIISSTNLANIWAGGEVVVRIKHYDLERIIIKFQSGAGNKAIHFLTPSRLTPPTNDFGFFLQNDTNALDLQGEWCYQKGRLYLYSTTNPSLLNVSVSKYPYNIACKSHNYITIENLCLENADTANVLIENSSHFTMLSDTLTQPGFDGVDVINNSSYFTCENNLLTNIPNEGIYMLNNTPYALIENNRIVKIGMVPGSGLSNGEKSYAAIVFDGTRSMFSYNYCDSIGCNGVECWTTADSMTIKNNYISHCEMVQDDNGAIHVLVSPSVFYNTRKIISNILLNGVGSPYGTSDSLDNGFTHGIYLDQRSMKYTVTGNTIANMPGNGILLHGSKQDTLKGNILFNNGQYMENVLPNAQLNMQDASVNSDIYNDSAIQVMQNTFAAMDTNQKVFTLYESSKTGNACSTYATYDSNYYCRPFYDTNKIIYLNDATSHLVTYYGLQKWVVGQFEILY